jgi:hypothetical protein
MGHRLFAALVPASCTADAADGYLARLLDPLIAAGVIDDFWLGGQVTGAWDPGYDPTVDPANWQPCSLCGGTNTTCHLCCDAVGQGRTVGTVVAAYYDFQPYPGDLVPLTRLLDPAWRFPTGRTPIAWVDPAGLTWLHTETAVLTCADGDMPPRLRQLLDHLIDGRSQLSPDGPFRLGDWAVAVVDTHH